MAQIQARATYRALLREIPARSRNLNNPSPLQSRIRALFRSETQHPSTNPSITSTQPTSSTAQTNTAAIPFSLPKSIEETEQRILEAEQLAKYARAQRTYVELLDRYNPGMNMEEEERIRLTARRVGFDLPELHEPEAEGK